MTVADGGQGSAASSAGDRRPEPAGLLAQEREASCPFFPGPTPRPQGFTAKARALGTPRGRRFQPRTGRPGAVPSTPQARSGACITGAALGLADGGRRGACQCPAARPGPPRGRALEQMRPQRPVPDTWGESRLVARAPGSPRPGRCVTAGLGAGPAARCSPGTPAPGLPPASPGPASTHPRGAAGARSPREPWRGGRTGQAPRSFRRRRQRPGRSAACRPGGAPARPTARPPAPPWGTAGLPPVRAPPPGPRAPAGGA